VRAERYTGYQRLLDRMAAGILTTETAMDSDPGAALVAYVKYLYRMVGRIRRRQKARLRHWQEQEGRHLREGRGILAAPDARRGLGARVDSLERWERRHQLLEMALGIFTSAGVVELRLPREGDVANVGDLLVYQLEELEAIATEKGGIRQLLDEKWRKVYKANAPRGLFDSGEMRVA